MRTLAFCASLLAVAPLVAQDTAFRSMQERGHMAMGVDQYTSAHQFDLLPDGGRIALDQFAAWSGELQREFLTGLGSRLTRVYE